MDYRQLGHDRGYGLAIGSFLSFDEVLEMEENSRQYSPFELTAKMLNEAEHPDEAWAEFEDGIYEGIDEALSE